MHILFKNRATAVQEEGDRKTLDIYAYDVSD